jgi:hypothetical protein
MKTKEKPRRKRGRNLKEGERLFPEMKESDMTAIDRKIHDLLTAEGYRVIGAQRIEGMELNNYTNVNRMEYMNGAGERAFIITHEHRKETA